MTEAGTGAGTPGEDVTRLLGGKLLLRQASTGHRVGTDAVLLAAAVAPHDGDLVVDVGSGVGSVGLAVALRHRAARVRLVEVVPGLAGLARDNVALNALQDRVEVETRDVLHRGGHEPRPGAAWVVSNPPFQLAETGRPSPDHARMRAHQLSAGVGHGDWLLAMLRYAGPQACLALIHRPDALPALLAAAQGRVGSVRVLSVHARAGDPAIRILFGGVVGSRAPLTLLPPVVLHDADGSFTPRAAALHAGESVIELLPTQKSRPRGPAS